MEGHPGLTFPRGALVQVRDCLSRWHLRCVWCDLGGPRVFITSRRNLEALERSVSRIPALAFLRRDVRPPVETAPAP